MDDKLTVKEVAERYAALNLKPYGGFVNPEIVPVVKDGKIVLSGETKPYCEEQGASLDEIFRRMFRC